MNNMPRRGLSIKTRLIIIILITVISVTMSLSIIVWQDSRRLLETTINAQMMALMRNKAAQITQYFDLMFHQVEAMTEDQTTIDAMVEFNLLYEDLDGQPIPPAWEDAVQTFYVEEFFPNLQPYVLGELEFGGYRPGGQAAYYLQYQYVIDNIELTPLAGTEETTQTAQTAASAADETEQSAYDEALALYDERLRRFIENFGYEDMYLINFETGTVVYSVQRNVDFGTSLLNGPYRLSGLAEVVRAVQQNPTRWSLQVEDYTRYQPALSAPAAFVAGPIYNGPHVIGIIALRMPSATITQILTGDNSWAEEGLGMSGQSFLVGPDFRLRSEARGLLEDPAAYEAALRNTDIAAATRTDIGTFQTSLLLQPANTVGVAAALEGRTDVIIQRNAFGTEVLSVFAPLDLPGLDWVIVTEMNLDEVYAPIHNLEARILITSVVLIAVSTFVIIFLASLFMRPITRLMAGMQADWQDAQVQNSAERHDEVGTLTRSVLHHLTTMQAERDQSAATNQRYFQKLASQLPANMVPLLKDGATDFWERVPQGTVVAIHVHGLGDAIDTLPVEQTAKIIQHVEMVMYDIAERYGLELFARGAQNYIALSGFATPRPDNAQRALSFALELVQSVGRLQPDPAMPLTLRVGLDSGSVVGGIGDERRFDYAFYGKVMQEAERISHTTTPNTVAASTTMQELLHELFTFTRVDNETWVVTKHGAQPESAESEQL